MPADYSKVNGTRYYPPTGRNLTRPHYCTPHRSITRGSRLVGHMPWYCSALFSVLVTDSIDAFFVRNALHRLSRGVTVQPVIMMGSRDVLTASYEIF